MLNISQCSTTGWKEKNYTGQYELKSFKDEQKYATFWQIKKKAFMWLHLGNPRSTTIAPFQNPERENKAR